MALECVVGKSESPASPGSIQLISGLSFQPALVLMYVNRCTSDTSIGDHTMGLGAATGAINQWAVSGDGDNLAAGATRQYFETRTTPPTRRIILIVEAAVATVLDVEFESFATDGVNCNFRTTTSGVDIHWICIGGTDVTNVVADNTTAPGSATTLNVTAPGFQADWALVVHTADIADSTGTSGTLHVKYSIGFGIPDGNQSVLSITDRSGNNPAQVSGGLNNSNVARVFDQFDATDHLAALSVNANGFDLDYSTSTGADRLMYVALKGPQVAVGTETSPASATTKSTTVTGQTPELIFCLSNSRPAQSAREDDLQPVIGAASAATERGCIWAGVDEVDDGDRGQDSDTLAVLKFLTPGDATPTLREEADLDSFASDTFTLDWTTAETATNQFAYTALGEAAGAPPFSLATLPHLKRPIVQW